MILSAECRPIVRGFPVKMQIKYLHPWDITSYNKAVNIQAQLKGKLILHDKYFPREIRTIAGADISYSKQNDMFFSAVVLLANPTMDIIEEVSVTERAPFPYIPGLLSFREGPALLKAFEKLTRVPDCVIFDGHGTAHPRGIGLASHMGLFLDIPTIGCAKRRLVGVHGEVGPRVGDYTDLKLDGRIIGAVVRIKKKVNPLFISPGHKIGLRRAVQVALSCCRGYRLTEPVRRAHLAVNRIRSRVATSC
ncbi:MAG TPA: deoxyribonuclease V [Syntrophales bacterium]|nr:deoxyribonuclease V [Syntrophales bacterium]